LISTNELCNLSENALAGFKWTQTPATLKFDERSMTATKFAALKSAEAQYATAKNMSYAELAWQLALQAELAIEYPETWKHIAENTNMVLQRKKAELEKMELSNLATARLAEMHKVTDKFVTWKLAAEKFAAERLVAAEKVMENRFVSEGLAAPLMAERLAIWKIRAKEHTRCRLAQKGFATWKLAIDKFTAEQRNVLEVRNAGKCEMARFIAAEYEAWLVASEQFTSKHL